MAQTAEGPRKTEFVGVPMDEGLKNRLRAVARKRNQKPTVVARDYIVAGIVRDEKRQPVGAGR